MIDQLAPDAPLAPELVRGMRAWKDDYPWFHQALTAIGPGARDASDGWRVRIQDELKTTLDFKVRPDDTAAVWCGMSQYEFHHYPTPKELFEGLAEAYRRELKRKSRTDAHLPRFASADAAPSDWAKLQLSIRTLRPPTKSSLTRTLGAVILPRAEHFMLIFLAVTAFTLALSTVAILAVR